MEVIAAVEEVTGRKVPYTIGPRREGDPPSLVAASDKLRDRLGWKPQYRICVPSSSTPGISPPSAMPRPDRRA